MSDLCISRFCSDIAAPGQDYCSACLEDLRVERAMTAAAARERTVEYEQRVKEEV